MTKEQVINEFVRQHFGPEARAKLVPLTGGLEARGIVRALVLKDEQTVGSFVAKPFDGIGSREIQVYRSFGAEGRHLELSPALLGWRCTGANQGYAFLEWIPADAVWPWRNVDYSVLVAEQLAFLHDSQPPTQLSATLAAWDYERELNDSAQSTLDVYRETSRAGVRPGKRPMGRALARLVAMLPRLRRQLLSFTGTALIHGDAHPGNVVLTSRGSTKHAVFIDWARARIGSPLEDLSSWVHSLGVWEPEAKRRHDTLLKHYLIARGRAATVTGTFRDACILAGACNALAGALRYHLSVLFSAESSARAKFDSERAAADWLRIIRRADECFAR